MGYIVSPEYTTLDIEGPEGRVFWDRIRKTSEIDLLQTILYDDGSFICTTKIEDLPLLREILEELGIGDG